MVLLIDAGNSRLKWAWLRDGRPGDEAGIDVAALDGAPLASAWRGATAALYTCVAGDAVDAALRAALPSGCAVHRIRSGEQAAGLTNLYERPAQLGADRWVALIGARTLVAGPLVVATAGTATTVDALDEADRFLGGYILPGLHLMLESLARNTADLPHAQGAPSDWPRNTDDAILNGCAGAQAALIARVRDRLGSSATLLLSGGGADALSPHIEGDLRRADNLVLRGLARLAADVLK
ncbi:type III pantothenate kinase [Methyloversatilis universalis]|uniref:type III pantothenate kinase n=1 Tax=Methyloversatilis universalis TaxID=378211 RepID=UPI00035C395C|nr:type III pantothenate kinase [Methyloversatilis universalis]